MRPAQLYEYYLTLYQIAWGGSWPSIQKYGLLSSKELLRSYGKRGDEFKTLTQVRRECWVKVNCLGRPPVILRDQKPLNKKKLKKALPKNVEPWQWYDLINSMVFFWPTKKRLKSMISAKVYSELYHDVLLVDTKKLVELEEQNIRLSHINSGNTFYKPQPRDLGLFKRIEDYQIDYWIKKRGLESAVAEVCVLDSVDRIHKAVIGTKHGKVNNILKDLEITTEPKFSKKDFKKLF